jgi:cupin superfamily acireductone dioxygenase involved in methionine salvage
LEDPDTYAAENKWVRVHVKGDLMTLPEGIYRFTCDEDRLIRCVSLLGNPFGRLLIVPNLESRQSKEFRSKEKKLKLFDD